MMKRRKRIGDTYRKRKGTEIMSLMQSIKDYRPCNPQEEKDKEAMIRYMADHPDYLERENVTAHFTTSIWTINKEHTKTLMVYHNIYDSWSWIGGHADGIEDLCSVAMRELQEETGIRKAALMGREIFSLEILTVNGHIKKGVYVPSHLHLNVTYLAEADENEELVINTEENQAVKWWTFEEALRVSKEPWMVRHVYQKLIDKCMQ